MSAGSSWRAEADVAKAQLVELWREVFEAADSALELEPAEREAFLDRCLVDHPAVGAELKALRRRQATLDAEGRVIPLAG